jgi:hypothetical protein
MSSSERSHIDRQHICTLELLRAALVENIEMADRRDLIAPELDSNRVGRAEAE